MSKRHPASSPEHEGAEEHLNPGEPAEREVITPDWVELEETSEPQASHTQTPPTVPPKSPAIDRHR
jgi:hypothetical protein